MNLSEQFLTMISMTAMGTWIGGSLTTYHRFVHPRKRWRWIMILTDVFFWFVQALLMFLVLLNVNDGQIRFYIFLALLCGFALYKSLLETLYAKILEKMIVFAINTSHFVKRTCQILLIKPVIFLLKLIYELVKMIGKILLTITIFLLTILSYPLKWIYILVFPRRFREWLIKSSHKVRSGYDWLKEKITFK